MPQAGTRVFERLPVIAVEPFSLQAFGLATACAAVAFTLRYVIGLFDPSVPPFAAFLVATMVAAILAGSAAGLFCAALGLALTWTVFVTQVPSAFGWGGLVLYVTVSALIIWIASEYRGLLRQVRSREETTSRQMRLVQAENRTLEMIAADEPLAETLGSLCVTVEEYSGCEVLATVLLLDADGKQLRHCAAPNLPEKYNRAIDGLEIGPGVGSCGTAAYQAKPVYVSDIQTDPLWKNYRELADQYGLRSCWSTPIMSRNNTILGTFALYGKKPSSPEPAEIEIVSLLVKIAAIAIERQRGREQRELLMHELSHRVKNSLAVVSSVASNTLRQHVDKARYEDFEQRIQALAEVQSMLVQSSWNAIDVNSLMKKAAVAPFVGADERFRCRGPSVRLPAELMLPFALSVHELCTNAAKYGALSTESGSVEVEWWFEPEDSPEHFFFRWVEAGGPPVVKPTKTGFGSRMIKRAFAQSFGGDAVWRYHPEGLQCEMRLPVDKLWPGDTQERFKSHMRT